MMPPSMEYIIKVNGWWSKTCDLVICDISWYAWRCHSPQKMPKRKRLGVPPGDRHRQHFSTGPSSSPKLDCAIMITRCPPFTVSYLGWFELGQWKRHEMAFIQHDCAPFVLGTSSELGLPGCHCSFPRPFVCLHVIHV